MHRCKPTHLTGLTSLPNSRHGTFRPSLMNLVSSNDAATTQNTIQEAIDEHRRTGKSQSTAALRILTQLKGIGPATASLLLAVHDPDAVVFFADEAFYWLCCSGKRSPIKYNVKEYQLLNERAAALTARLGVRAVDVERAAFVLMREPTENSHPEDEAHVDAKPAGKKPSAAKPAKRKQADDNVALEGPRTRSKRGRKS